ncbi:MAG: TetR family transcriptional regulator [Methylomicrobium sp.]
MIIKASKEIIADGGGGALNVRKIAMKIGYTVGSIYMVFENMADLVLHINADTLDEIAEEIGEVEGDPQDCLKEMTSLYLSFLYRNFNRWSILFFNRFVAIEHWPEWYHAKFERIIDLFERQIERALPGSPAQRRRHLANALWGGINGVCILSIDADRKQSAIADIEKTLMVLVEQSVRP